MLTEQGIDDRLVLPLDDRPTTLKERYIGRAQDRHPQQMIRVDYEKCDPIPAVIETRLHGELDAVLVAGRDRPDLGLRQGRLHADALERRHREIAGGRASACSPTRSGRTTTAGIAACTA